MGKFDVFLKYLGKEDSFSPDEIMNKIELDKQQDIIESTNVEENLSRVDELIAKISSPSSQAEVGETKAESVELDREIIDIIERLDNPPPDINKLKENLSIQTYEEASQISQEEASTEEVPTGFEDILVEHEEIQEEGAFYPEETAIPSKDQVFTTSQESIEDNIPDFSFEGIEQPVETNIPEEEIFPSQMDFFTPEEEVETPKSEAKEIDLSSFEERPKAYESYFEEKEEPTSSIEEMDFSNLSLPEVEEKPSFKEPSYDKSFKDIKAEIEIDQEKALKIRNRINKIKNPDLRKKVRYALLDFHLPKELENELLKMLLLNEPEEKLKKFIELNLKVEEVAPPVKEEFETPSKRRVIYSEEIKRQKEVEESLKKLSRFTFAGFLLLIFLGFAFWRYIWIPYIVEGVYNKGLKALARNDIVEAENLFRKAKEMGGVNIKWYNIYARKYIELTNFEAARKKFIEALEYDPVNKITIYNFADYYKTIYPPRYEDALSLYYRLYKKDPNNFEYIDKIGKTFVEWGDKTQDYNERIKKYAEADRLYENYLTKKPKFVGGYFRLLDIALRMKKADRIDVLFDTIEKINKRAVSETTFTSLAKYYLDEKRYDRAKKVFDKLIPYLTPPDKTNIARALLQSEAYYEHGRFLTIHLDFKKAIIQLSNSIKLNPKNAKAYNLLGEIYLLDEKGINSKLSAKDMFDNAIKYDPLFYKPYANMGHLYYYNSFNFDEPEKAYSQAFYYYKIAASLLKDEKDYLLSYNLGWLYYRYKDYENALNEFSKIYIEETYNPIVSYNMGNIFFKMNKYELAKVQYEKSISYLENIANKISYLNPELTRHKELYTQLARNYNNIGVVYLQLIKSFPRQKNQLEQEALLNFYKAKDNALRVNTIYSYAEYNIKSLLNKSIKNRNPVFDDELLHKTSLKKFIDEYRDRIIKSL